MNHRLQSTLPILSLVLFALSPVTVSAQRSYGAGGEGSSGGARGSSAAERPGTQVRTYRAGEVTGANPPGVGRPLVGRVETNIDNRHEPVEPPMRDDGPQRYDFRRPYDNRPGDIGLGGSYDPGHGRPWRPWDYYRSYYPYIPLQYVDGPVEETRPSTANYAIVKPAPQVWVEGHYEKVPMEDVIEGETIEVHHPAIYEQDADGKLTLVEKERVTREPKTRIIVARVWIEGHYETAPPEMRRARGENESGPLPQSRAGEMQSPQRN